MRRAPASAPTEQSSSGSTTAGVGPESEEQTFQPGLAADDDLDLETVPDLSEVGPAARDGLDLPPTRRIDREQHPPVVGARHVRRRRSDCPGRAAPSLRPDRRRPASGGGDPVHPEPAHVTCGLAPGVDVPVASVANSRIGSMSRSLTRSDDAE